MSLALKKDSRSLIFESFQNNQSLRSCEAGEQREGERNEEA